MSNPQNLKPFQPGDPRINRCGRPSPKTMLRELTRKINEETLNSADPGATMTRVEAILTDWATSKEFKKQLAFVEYAFGKVPKNEPPAWNVEVVVDWTPVVPAPFRPQSQNQIIDIPPSEPAEQPDQED